jgi:hypothetical protein
MALLLCAAYRQTLRARVTSDDLEILSANPAIGTVAWGLACCAALLAVAADGAQTLIWQNSGTVFGAMVDHNPRDFGAQFNLGWCD